MHEVQKQLLHDNLALWDVVAAEVKPVQKVVQLLEGMFAKGKEREGKDEDKGECKDEVMDQVLVLGHEGREEGREGSHEGH